ncbi:MAG: hypothetical protein KJP12_06940 [Acidimicrobiia bacterium]|nr:hypothetical protein [Acidimicrobiia bacterium]MBT8214945.1 hypothetical protein [Acidimicrobiia bacterium]NNF69583.1 hypothetical protein [Acidimicrobiia bacterium]NNK91664.1 hypothetical protein [Acidimicrobiia bacterium]
MDPLADLLKAAGKAHHEAFISTDGADPEWPLWYADFLVGRIGEHLERSVTKSELVYLLVAADRASAGGEAPWPEIYADFLRSGG